MATFKYNLKDSKATSKTPLYLSVRFGYMRVKYYVGESIIPSYWDHKEQRVKSSMEGHTELNTTLNRVKVKAEEVCRRLVNDGYTLTPALVKDEFETYLRPITHPNTRKNGNKVKTFMEFFDRFIQERKNTDRPNTIKKYNTTLKHLQDFSKARRKPINFNDIDMNFYHDFLDYLYNKLELSTNSAGKYIRVLITVLGEATERGLNKKMTFKKKGFKAVYEPVSKVFLTLEEIDKIYNHDLSKTPGLERVRDLFIIECHTGFRFSDIVRFDPMEHIEKTERGDIITITTVKTNVTVSVPLHYQVREILDKYEGKLPSPIENQPTNRYLKDICKKAEINTMVTKKTSKKGKVAEEKVPKYSLITTHTGRRSFATNMYLAGFNSGTIKAFTGHKTEASFLEYIGAGSREVACNLADHKYFTGKEGPTDILASNLKAV